MKKSISENKVQRMRNIVTKKYNDKTAISTGYKKIKESYGGSSFYRFRFENTEVGLMHDYDVKRSLIDMIKENHGESMLNVKSNELLKKLELL